MHIEIDITENVLYKEGEARGAAKVLIKFWNVASAHSPTDSKRASLQLPSRPSING